MKKYLIVIILLLLFSCKSTEFIWKTTAIQKWQPEEIYQNECDIDNFINYALLDYQKKHLKVVVDEKFIYFIYPIKEKDLEYFRDLIK